MSERTRSENNESSTDELQETSFDEIKEVAFQNVGSMLKDLQAFERAIQNEDIAEIYRIYKGKLHEEIKSTSNRNHEIDELLAQKIHDSFTQTFPFIHHAQKVSPTMHYYRLGNYYRERPTIAIDASVPEIFILPKIDKEWQEFAPGKRDALNKIEKEMDELDAKVITAESELSSIDEQIKETQNKKSSVENTKGLFNRNKTDEEVEELDRKISELQEKRKEWVPYVEDETKTNQEKEELMKSHHDIRLKQAVVTKEFRLIQQYFGSLKAMNQQIQDFLSSYLGKAKGGNKS
ncbi:MAG: viral A-type inclusion protein [Tetragenococcus sp.]|nr:viral A-type inclusion protein [Tetragenococcus sp.]